MENPKNHKMFFRLDEEDYQLLQHKFKQTECKNLSEFMRKMIVNGYILEYNSKEITDLLKYAKSVSDNVNQIARTVNENGKIYADDIQEIKDKVTQIYSRQLEILERFEAMAGVRNGKH